MLVAVILAIAGFPAVAEASPQVARWVIEGSDATIKQIDSRDHLAWRNGRLLDSGSLKSESKKVSSRNPTKIATKTSSAYARWQKAGKPTKVGGAKTQARSATAQVQTLPETLPDDGNPWYEPLQYEVGDANACNQDGSPYLNQAFVESHTYACSGGQIKVTAFGSQGAPIGAVYLQVFSLHAAWTGNAEWRYEPMRTTYKQYWELLWTEGDINGFDALIFEAGVDCWAVDPVPSHGCTPSSSGSLTGAMLLATSDGPPIEVLNGAFSEFSLTWYYTEQYLWITSPNGAAPVRRFGLDIQRCDNDTSDFVTKTGCVFDDAASDLLSQFGRLDVSDPDITEASQHVADALLSNFDPTAVSKPIYPENLGNLTIPGNWDWPLLRDQSRSAANRSARDQACADLAATMSTTTGLQCDEFAFANTLQGAANTGFAYSVRYIPTLDNGEAGYRYGAWLVSQRIVPRVDWFYVTVQIPNNCSDCSCMVC